MEEMKKTAQTENTELTDEALDEVAGGAKMPSLPKSYDTIVCWKCGSVVKVEMNQKKATCLKCHITIVKNEDCKNPIVDRLNNTMLK